MKSGIYTSCNRVGDEFVRALDGVDFEIYEGEFCAIVGTSGSGKSTFMNMLGCLDTPDSGEYFLDGKDVANLSDMNCLISAITRLASSFRDQSDSKPGCTWKCRTSADLPWTWKTTEKRDCRGKLYRKLDWKIVWITDRTSFPVDSSSVSL